MNGLSPWRPIGAAVILVLLTAQPSWAAQRLWYEHYELAIELLDEGNHQQALEHLQSAVAERSEPGLGLRTYGLHYVDYLPYLHLAVASFMTGDGEQGWQHLERSREAGFAERSDRGRKLLEALTVLPGLSRTERQVAPEVESNELPRYRVFDRQATVLSDEELTALQRDVVERSPAFRSVPLGRAPWYFHYEVGLELERQGDPQRALDAFLEAANKKTDSKRRARLYGVWFKDYLPYFAIARTHVTLGNWECAASALQVSQGFHEIGPQDRESGELDGLLSQIAARQAR